MKIGIIGTGSRATAYASIILSTIRPGVDITAIADTDPKRIDFFLNKFYKDNDTKKPNVYDDHITLLENEAVDALIICTPDTTHRQIAIDCLKKDKHILLEKPIATTIEDCAAIYEESLLHDVVFKMGFVLRYTNIYSKIRQIIKSGMLGQIVTVEAKEILGHLHAGSFFRRWHRHSINNGGFLNAKCSHDMDMLNWLIDDEPAYVCAFGGRSYFNPKKDASDRCPDCKLAKSCRYFFKLSDYADAKSLDDVCVFNSDKDIVDHEILSIEYKNGVTASFTVSMFGEKGTRTLSVFGSDAILSADLTDLYIKVSTISPKDETVYRFGESSTGHGGGDGGICADFIDAIRYGTDDNNEARAGALASIIALSGEVSMKHKKIIDISGLI